MTDDTYAKNYRIFSNEGESHESFKMRLDRSYVDAKTGKRVMPPHVPPVPPNPTFEADKAAFDAAAKVAGFEETASPILLKPDPAARAVARIALFAEILTPALMECFTQAAPLCAGPEEYEGCFNEAASSMMLSLGIGAMNFPFTKDPAALLVVASASGIAALRQLMPAYGFNYEETLKRLETDLTVAKLVDVKITGEAAKPATGEPALCACGIYADRCDRPQCNACETEANYPPGSTLGAQD